MENRHRYRLKFVKLNKMKFIGHLDLLRIMQRAIKRANLPIEFSQGFNPHQMVSFALPLSLGLTSIGEYIDINLVEEIEPEEIIEKLNFVLPKGLEIVKCRKFFENEKSAASSVQAGIYEAIFTEMLSFEDVLVNILSAEKIMVEKKTKSGIKEVDIRQDIFQIENASDEHSCKIRFLISAGSEKNLKPQLLTSYICTQLKKEFNPFEIKTQRVDLLKTENDSFISLFS